MTAKIAKAWFAAHPRSVVTFHHRWQELSQHSREILSTPRATRVVGNRVLFTPQSELSLKSIEAVADGATLQLYTGTNHFVTYQAAEPVA